ncbi:hypothetical protein [Caproiciproducens faecalis]|uniref:Uncharacterized protein n=1 Tax=Caproiciproducens faecalis TaxID=2820301 RepID=A0ABS7DRG6_9FIRM|nr:hypothetical protein [Caproiciproducens faecalis]MBW7573895.1 hypothetical protein [Caproiciproducens faecalis]
MDKTNQLYRCWENIKSRCSNPKDSHYHYYGEKGVTVCDDWKNSYSSFKSWALQNGFMPGLTIDRIDVNGNYCPENCRWITQKEQCSNRTSNRILTYNGVSHTVTQWSEIVGISANTIFARLDRGWSTEKSLTRPLDNRGGNQRYRKKAVA